MRLTKAHRDVAETAVPAAAPASVALGLCAATAVLFDAPVPAAFYVAAFSGTFLVYLADRALPFSPEDTVNRGAEGRVITRTDQVLIGVAMIAAVGSLPFLRITTLLAAAAIGAVGFAYVVPIRGRRFKDAGAVKPLLVAAGWIVGAVVLPLMEAGVIGASVSTLAVFLLYRLFFLLPNTLLADLADVRGDLERGIRTPAAAWGEERIVCASIAAAAVGLILALLALPTLRPLILLDAAGLLIVSALIYRARDRRSQRFRLALDLMMLWPLVLVLCR